MKKSPKYGYAKCDTPLPGAERAYVFMPSPVTREQITFLNRYLDLLVEAGDYEKGVGGEDVHPPDTQYVNDAAQDGDNGN